MKKLVLKAAWTLCLAAAAVAVAYPLCADGTGCDYLKLWLFAGIPFGIHRMFLWLIPKGFDIGGTAGVIAINFLVGDIIGGVIMVWQVGVAFFILARGIVFGLIQIFRYGEG